MIGLADSKSEAKRLIEQGVLEIDGIVIRDWRAKPKIKNDSVVKVDKRKFKRFTQ